MIGEVGLGGVKDGPTGRQMIAWARKYGMTSMTHTGGPSIPGSGRIGADVVLEVDADVVAHVNGGPTALPDDEIVRICEESTRALEIVHNGNLRTGLFVLDLAQAARRACARHPRHRRPGRLRRAAARHPAHDHHAGLAGRRRAGSRVLLRHAATPRACAGWPTAASSQVGRAADLDLHGPGRWAAPATGFLDSIALGNLPGIGMVMVDGVVRTGRSRNTPPGMPGSGNQARPDGRHPGSAASTEPRRNIATAQTSPSSPFT